jgi:taurine dioxygenase
LFSIMSAATLTAASAAAAKGTTTAAFASNATGGTTAASSKKCSVLIPDIDEKRRSLLEQHGVAIEPIEPLGARVTGLDWNAYKDSLPPETVLNALEMEMAQRGFLVFPNQGVMTPQEQIKASCLWGGREMHSTHGVHPQTPEGNQHIFRLSNDPKHGILGVGPQYHNDGSFVEGTFSHVGYHIIRVPEKGGGTFFAHQGAAFDMLSPEDQERWSRLVSVNSNSGVLHPVVHKHSISGRKSVWLHLGMTGAVLERLEDEMVEQDKPPFRLLGHFEMKELFHAYNELLNKGLEEGYTMNYEYKEGDLIMIDNLAIGHRAAPEAHKSVEEQGLRILHRTTVRATRPFRPGFGLPQAIDIYGPHPFNEDGVWIGGGIGFRWDDEIHMQN